MKLLLFIVIEVLLLPITAIGGIVFSIEIMLKTFRRGFSVTAYSPFFARWFLHHLGQRTDETATAL